MYYHGNFTADAVIQAVDEGSVLVTRYPFMRVLNDKRQTSGDWSEALP